MSKVVLTKEEAERVAVTFTPRRFPTVITEAAESFIAINSGEEGSSFRLDDIVANRTGIASLERASIEEKVELEALERMKELQEQAHAQAYQLGLEEGRERAFEERKAELDQKITHLEELLMAFETMKADLVTVNEAQLVKLVLHMAKRVVIHEIATQPEVILNLVQQTVESIQTDETITVRVSPSDHKFLEDIKESLGKDFERLKRAKLEAAEEITSGGCVVATNYGEVDATVEQRLDKLWESVAEKLPKVKNVVGG